MANSKFIFFLMLACPALLIADTVNVHLRFEPGKDLDPDRIVYLGIFKNKSVKFEKMIDARKIADSKLIGKSIYVRPAPAKSIEVEPVFGDPSPVDNSPEDRTSYYYTNTNITEWSGDVLRYLFKSVGIRVDTVRPDLIVRPTLFDFFVLEENTYKGRVRLKLEVLDSTGGVIKTYVTSGESNYWGRSLSAGNYNSSIGNAWINILDALFSNSENTPDSGRAVGSMVNLEDFKSITSPTGITATSFALVISGTILTTVALLLKSEVYPGGLALIGASGVCFIIADVKWSRYNHFKATFGNMNE
jgi:hypothetical protein